MVTLEHSLDGPRNLSIALEMMVGNEPLRYGQFVSLDNRYLLVFFA